MTLVRFRQIVAAIQLRQFGAERKAVSQLSWAVRTLAQFTAMGFQVKPEDNTALDASLKLGYDEIEQAVMGHLSQQKDTKKENAPGSYERALGLFGRGL